MSPFSASLLSILLLVSTQQMPALAKTGAQEAANTKQSAPVNLSAGKASVQSIEINASAEGQTAIGYRAQPTSNDNSMTPNLLIHDFTRTEAQVIEPASTAARPDPSPSIEGISVPAGALYTTSDECG